MIILDTQAPSQIHIIEGRKVLDVGKSFVERLPRGYELQHRGSPDRLDNQPTPFFAEKGLVAGKLQVARNLQNSIPAIPKQTHDPFRLHESSWP